MITTLNKIRAHDPCTDGWEKLLRHLGKTRADNKPLSIVKILASNGVDDALWCLRAVENCDPEIRLFAIWCARRVEHLISGPRSREALDVAKRFARGKATDEELKAARKAALYAARAAKTASASAAAAAASWAAAETATVRAAVESAAAAASRAAAETAGRFAANARAAERAAERAAQADELRRVCVEIEAGRDPYPEEIGQ